MMPAAGIWMNDTVVRRTVRGRSCWRRGPRTRQALHVRKQDRYQWTSRTKSDVPIEDTLPGDPGPVLEFFALKSQGDVFRIIGGME